MERIQANDQIAWRILVERYGGLVLYWCRKAGLQSEDRADVFQEVFRAVARHIGDYEHRATGHAFRGWLCTITRSKLAGHFRGGKYQAMAQGGSTMRAWLEEVPEAASNSSADLSSADLNSDDEDAILMHAALQRVQQEFGERPWQAFWRTMVDGLPTEIVADELAMSTSAIYAAKSRILKRLREELDAA